MRRYSLLFAAVIGVLALFQCRFSAAPRLGRSPVKDVVAAMTLEEKAYFVTGAGTDIAAPGNEKPEKRIAGAPVVGQTQRLVPGAAGTTYEIPRLGIPAMVLADGPAGLRISPVREKHTATYYCT